MPLGEIREYPEQQGINAIWTVAATEPEYREILELERQLAEPIADVWDAISIQVRRIRPAIFKRRFKCLFLHPSMLTTLFYAHAHRAVRDATDHVARGNGLLRGGIQSSRLKFVYRNDLLNWLAASRRVHQAAIPNP